jgi:hypothetical protein
MQGRLPFRKTKETYKTMESKSVIILLVVILLSSSCKSKKLVETIKVDSVITLVQKVELATDSSDIETTEEIAYIFDTLVNHQVTPLEAIRGDYKHKLKAIHIKRHIKERKRLKSLKIDKKENKAIKVDKTVIQEEKPKGNNTLLIILGIGIVVYLILKKL